MSIWGTIFKKIKKTKFDEKMSIRDLFICMFPFMGYTIAKRFDAIIAVMEENNGTYNSYQTKSDMIFGQISTSFYDYIL